MGSAKVEMGRLKTYAQALPAQPNFIFDPVGKWHRCHGDGKAETSGMFHIETMHGKDQLYHVKIMRRRGGKIWGKTYTNQPTSAVIVTDIKNDLA